MRGLSLTIAVCVALVLAGCGGDDTTTEATSPPDATTAAKADAGGSGASPKASGDGSASAKGKASKPIKRPTVSIEVPVRPPPEIEPPAKPPKELVIKDLEVGSGPPVRAGDEVTVHYQGIDMSGKVRYSSWRNGSPFAFNVGEGFYGKGFERGIEGMRVGGRRELGIPSDLAAFQVPAIYVVDLLGR